MKIIMGELMNNISSYDTNIMLAAIISLLLVILFVLLLHIYARWFLTLSRHSRAISSSSSSSVTISYALRPHPFHSSSPDSKGLDPSLISSIPLFVYTREDEEEQRGGLECAVCLSVFEANEIGRRLAKCRHCFHVECIDMWLHSHLNCPVCRAPAAAAEDGVKSSQEIVGIDVENIIESDYSASSSSPTASLTCSNSSGSAVGCCSDNLKWMMLSRNRSDGCKVFPSIAKCQLLVQREK